MKPADLLAVPGVAESHLDPSVAATLPESVAPAPWTCASAGVVWWSRARGVAGSSAATVAAGRGKPVVVIGGLISYASTPVGTYHEVFGGIGTRNGRGVEVSIPFMAVDSPASVVGGRSNWSLPKVLASFTGEPGRDWGLFASGEGWTVRVTARPLLPRMSAKMKGLVVQRWPDGSVRTAMLDGRGKSRLALVNVDVTSSVGDLASWLRPGRHLGVITSSVEFTLPEMTS